ncbi:hypothetical protein Nepgr_005613 [Nepenthes gracilis]|uniref:Uncharacterized protein n=1 Tax=Nepenthes gracilis TaxID=150966 RepID=A0AAD3S3Y2_NEPGR|nr:hypothetical protein Nepgr_005613 [Nepenthes gracilis]
MCGGSRVCLRKERGFGATPVRGWLAGGRLQLQGAKATAVAGGRCGDACGSRVHERERREGLTTGERRQERDRRW